MQQENDFMDHFDFHARIAAEVTSLTIVLGGLVSVLPTLGILLGCIWYGLNIYDWYVKRRRAARRLPHTVDEMKAQTSLGTSSASATLPSHQVSPTTPP